MDVYWSVEHCGWVACAGPPDPLATPWSLQQEPEQQPVTAVPEQRLPQQERTDA